MKTKRSSVKVMFVTTAVSAVMLLAGARAAFAVGETCYNDDDCPNPACGGEVCDWPNKSLKCRLAGEVPAPNDGWCMDDTDCKCKAEGATCNTATYHCTFTTKPASGGSGGASGTASGGASGTASGGASGTASGGASGTASGGASGTATGGSSGGSSSGGGGCSVATTPISGAFGLLAGVGLLGVALAGRSRRRR